MLSNLLAGYMKANPTVQARMVAAYVIGFSITQQYLDANPHLGFATGPDDPASLSPITRRPRMWRSEPIPC